jgi:glycosyltransferase involved in cell wall biosynthesis
MDRTNGVTPAQSGTLTVVILTYNEALHIERCILNAQRVADEVLVVDSYSTDATVPMARQLGARVLQNCWTNHATQLNWALQHGSIRAQWVMRLDADEFLSDQLLEALPRTLSEAPEDIGGFEVDRRIRFLGHEIRHGGMAPLWITRLWRSGWAHCEARWMDEHIVLTRGRISRLPGAIIDENLNTLTWWTQKHNLYANREAADLLDRRHSMGVAEQSAAGLNRQARIKRWLKAQVYARLPLGLRPWFYFFYRAVIRLGVLDGARGMMFHTLQGLWYRLLVDAKVAEVERAMAETGCAPSQAIREVLGIEMNPARTRTDD